MDMPFTKLLNDLAKIEAGAIRDAETCRKLLRRAKKELKKFSNPAEDALTSAFYGAQSVFVSGWDGTDDDE